MAKSTWIALVFLGLGGLPLAAADVAGRWQLKGDVDVQPFAVSGTFTATRVQ